MRARVRAARLTVGRSLHRLGRRHRLGLRRAGPDAPHHGLARDEGEREGMDDTPQLVLDTRGDVARSDTWERAHRTRLDPAGDVPGQLDSHGSIEVVVDDENRRPLLLSLYGDGI